MNFPSDIDATIKRIRDRITGGDETNAALAAIAGVDEKIIRQAAGPSWNPTASTLRKVMAILRADAKPRRKAAA